MSFIRHKHLPPSRKSIHSPSGSTYDWNVWPFQDHQHKHAGPALTAIAFIIFLTAVLFVAADLQFQHLIIDSQVPWEHQPIPSPLNSAPSNQTHRTTIVEISTTGEGAHDHIVRTFCHMCERCGGSHPRLVCPNPMGQLLPRPWRCGSMHHTMTTHPQVGVTKSPWQNFFWAAFVRYSTWIGYSRIQFAYTASNLQSAFSQPSVLDDALVTECSLNHVLGPFDSPPLPKFRCSGLGLVPKQDGGWRTIYHLSGPLGKSINDFINPDTYTLTYCSVDDAFAIVNLLGPGTLLSKIDLEIPFTSYQLDKQTGTYLAYFGKASIISTHACHSAWALPPTYLIA